MFHESAGRADFEINFVRFGPANAADIREVLKDIDMTDSQLNDDLQSWSTIFDNELRSHLEDLQNAKSCGFAIELPSDFGNRDGVISRVAKTKRSVKNMDDWEYVPNLATFGRTCDGLEKIYEKYDDQLDDEAFYEQFGNQLYRTILNVMTTVISTEKYPSIKIWLLTLSDDEHPILDEAAVALNPTEQQALARKLII